MDSIVKFACEELGGAEISCLMVNGEPWFKGVEVAKALGYKKPSVAIHKHVTHKAKPEALLGKGKTKGFEFELSTFWLPRQGVNELVAKGKTIECHDMSAKSGVKVETRYIRKELEIVGFIQEFLTTLNIPFEFQKTVLRYRVDLFLPMHNIAVEIDEGGHADRDQNYEEQREQQITASLKCKFLRFNPDEPNFKISRCIATLTHHMFRT